MFFRMIKKDLKESRGLNVIILLFMVLVSTLVTASALLLFANIRGVKVSQQRCKPYDAIFAFEQLLDKREEQKQCYIDIIRKNYKNADLNCFEGIRLDSSSIDYEGMDVNNMAKVFSFGNYYLMKQPRDNNLVYDLNNKPFYVENGKMAIPYAFASKVGLSIGKAIYITAPNGRKYGFEIAYITRDPIHDQTNRFMISDSDYELMSRECPQKQGFIGLKANEDFTTKNLYSLRSLMLKDPDYGDYFIGGIPDGHTTSNAALASVLVTMFLSITAVFMVFIIFFTIGFTIKSVIKNEERELGIMKALGTDSVSFRWLVAAKYVAFSLAGGAIGAVVGVVLGDKLIGRFYYNISYSLSAVDYLVALISALVIILIVILFILISMRRIKKISVMDILHGEARSERIKHSDRFQLNKRSRMSLPFFLALSDILGNFKRYVFLLMAFIIGSSVVIMNIQIKDSVISPDFIYKFYNFKHIDAIINFDNKTWNELSGGGGSSDVFIRNLDKVMVANGLDATFEFCDFQKAEMLFEDGAENIELDFGFNPEGMVIRKGGDYPKLRNEVLIDYFTATSHDLKIGDSITIQYDKYTGNRLSTYTVEEEFIITGFVDRLSKFNTRNVIMAEVFNDAASQGYDAVGFTINVPESEKPEALKKIFEIFPGQCMTVENGIKALLGMYNVVFEFMRNMMFIVVAGVLGFLVVMYQTIFMKEEESEIALLTGSGFDEKTTKGWQFLRMIILFVSGVIISVILTPTLGAWMLSKLFCALLGITGFGFTRGLGLTIFWVVFITVFITFILMFVLRKIRNIEIWRIRNE